MDKSADSKGYISIDLTGPKRQLSEKEVSEYRDAFKVFDKDEDGCITKEELGNFMRGIGQFARETELQDMLQELDIDRNGLFQFEEFVYILSHVKDETTELQEAFRIFDKRNRGYIYASDLRAVIQCLGLDPDDEEIEEMIKEVDTNEDGRIDFNEFVRCMGEPE